MRFNLKNYLILTKKIMKLKTLLDSQVALAQLGETEKLPMVLSFKISKVIKKASEELDTFYKARASKLKELGTPIKKDGQDTDEYSLGDNKDKFKEEIEALQNEEITIEIPELSIADFGEITLKPNILASLDWLIKE